MYLCMLYSLSRLGLHAHVRMHFADVALVSFSDATFWVRLRLQIKFRSFSGERSTGVESERGVHAVTSLWVRRSGKFGGARAEQKEWNLASSLGSERFLLAFCQKVAFQRSATPKSYIILLLLSYMLKWKHEKWFFLTKSAHVVSPDSKCSIFQHFSRIVLYFCTD